MNEWKIKLIKQLSIIWHILRKVNFNCTSVIKKRKTKYNSIEKFQKNKTCFIAVPFFLTWMKIALWHPVKLISTILVP